MTPRTQDFFLFLIDFGWEQVIAVLVIAAIRPLGLLFGFLGFYWSMGQNRLVRMIIAVGIAGPVAVASVPTLASIVTTFSIVQLVALAITEMLIGLALALIASLPFFAMQYAGAITDQFRGEADSGITNPAGGTMSTMGMLYTLLALLAFAHADGISLLFEIFYSSYSVWPLASTLPELTYNAMESVFDLLSATFLLAVRLAFPLLLALGLIELGAIVGARLYKRYGFYNFSFLLKNLATILMLPLLVLYAWMLSQNTFLPIFAHFDLPEFMGR